MERAAVGLFLLCLLASPARAEADGAAPSPPPPKWEFSFSPYVWATAFDGTLEAAGHSADVDISFSDVLDALDATFLGAVEARRSRFSFTSNLIYLRMTDSGDQVVGPGVPNAPPGSFEVRLATDSLIVELRPAFEVLALPLFGADDERRIALDLGPAARIWWFDTHMHAKLDPGVPLGPFSRRFDGSQDWVDFVAAARVRAQLTSRIGLVIAGDYGGFDLGSSAHRTWSLLGQVHYALGEHWDIAAGWRELELERNAVDLELSGPLVGATYRF
jgi:hypothetical protein